MFRLRWLTLPLLAVAAAASAAAASSMPIIYFRPGSDSLDPAQRVRLDRVAALMAEYPSHGLLVDGHTDRAGSEAHNFLLSCRRARAVHAYLVTKGVASERMAIQSFGEARPMTSGPADMLEQASRRVELWLTDARRLAAGRHAPPC